MDVKKETTYGEQIKILLSRGCKITNFEQTCDILKKVNYYRLTAYLLPFKDADKDKYISGTDFFSVYKIYEFDQKLSVLLYSVIQEIEVFIKTQIAYYHANVYKPLGYLDSNNFKENMADKHKELINILKITIEKESKKKNPFVNHHIKNYDGKFPLWVAIELFSIGNISKFYAQMKTDNQKLVVDNIKDITGHYTDYKHLESWLRCLTDLRNKCAHFSRLYYYNFSSVPKIPRNMKSNALVDLKKPTKLYQYMFVLKFLYPRPEKWNNVITQMEALIEEYSKYISLEHIGFPENWLELL